MSRNPVFLALQAFGVMAGGCGDRSPEPYDLRPDELVLLESAARTVDVVAELQAALVGQPLVVPGSLGQVREHPLLSETRQQRSALARLLAQLKLPDDDTATSVTRSTLGRAAAQSRWAAAHGGRNPK